MNSFFFSQTGNGERETVEAGRRVAQIRLEKPLELCQRLVVERDVVEIRRRHAGFPEAIPDGLCGESGVVFLAREPFLLRGRRDPTVNDERGGAVVIER